MTELVAVRIIELAMAGEKDGDRLTARVLASAASRTTLIGAAVNPGLAAGQPAQLRAANFERYWAIIAAGASVT